MTRTVSIDGVNVAAESAVVSVFDRGFLYGDGVFETLRVYRGRPFARDAHLERLARSCASLAITLPTSIDAIGRELDDSVAASGLTDAYARITITRGVARRTSLVPDAQARATRVIVVEPLVLPPRDVYVDGLRAVTVPWTRSGEGGPASGAKLLSYVHGLLALDEARTRGANEAIFVGTDQRVRDASTSNVFLLAPDGTVVTPPDGAGVLAGITRGHVLDLAGSLGMRVAIASVGVDALRAAGEIFLTSSLREIASVVVLDGTRVGAGVPGDVARALHRAYRRRCVAVGPMPWE